MTPPVKEVEEKEVRPYCWIVKLPNGHRLIEWDHPGNRYVQESIIVPVYQQIQLEAAYEKGRRDGIEESAKVSDDHLRKPGDCDHGYQLACDQVISEMIRALIKKPGGEK